jgi:hypothetical protein
MAEVAGIPDHLYVLILGRDGLEFTKGVVG